MPRRKANAEQFYFSRGEIEEEFEKLLEEQFFANNAENVFIAGAPSL